MFFKYRSSVGLDVIGSQRASGPNTSYNRRETEKNNIHSNNKYYPKNTSEKSDKNWLAQPATTPISDSATICDRPSKEHKNKFCFFFVCTRNFRIFFLYSCFRPPWILPTSRPLSALPHAFYAWRTLWMGDKVNIDGWPSSLSTFDAVNAYAVWWFSRRTMTNFVRVVLGMKAVEYRPTAKENRRAQEPSQYSAYRE